MIPKQLTLQGFYSYRDRKQTINFEQLTAAGIFGVFGKVGSGKSAILEAILFALYGETERLNAKDNRYNMMNLQTDELYIDFEFYAGKDNNLYRFVAKGKKNKKGEVKIERFAYRNDEGAWIPIETSQAAQIVGLSYDNFRRTVIVPQGKFQEFLQLSGKERGEMMKELFDLHKYDLSAKTSVVERVCNDEKIAVSSRLDPIRELNESQLDEQKKGYNELNEQIRVLNRELLEKQAKATELSLLKTYVDDKTKYQQELSELQNQLTQIEQLEKQVNDYEYCVRNFQLLLSQLARNKQQQADLAESLKTTREKQSTLLNQIKQTEQDIDKIAAAYSQRESLKQQAEELGHISSVIRLQSELDTLKTRKEKGAQFIEEKKKEIAVAEQTLERLDAQKVKLKQQLPDQKQLFAIDNWHNIAEQQDKEEAKVQREFTASQQKLEQQKAEANQHIKAIDNQATWDNFSELLEQQSSNLSAELNQCLNTIAHFTVQRELADYAANLQEGSPCPLCGAVHHPTPLTAQANDAELAKSEGLRKQLEKKQQQLQALKNTLEQQFAVIQLLEQQKETDNKKLAQLIQDRQQHRQEFVWDTAYLNDRSLIKTHLEQLAELEKQLTDLDGTYTEVNNQLKLLNADKQKYEEGYTKLDNEFLQKQSEQNTLLKLIKELKVTDYQNKTADEITRQQQQLVSNYTKLTEQYEGLQKQLQNLQSEEKVTGSRVEGFEVQAQALNTEKQQWQKEVGEKLQSSRFASVDEVETILQSVIDVEKSRAEIQAYRNNVQNLNTKVQDLNEKLKDKTYSATEHQTLIEEISTAQQTLDNKKQQLGSLDAGIKSLTANLELQKKLLTDEERLTARAENIRVLKNLFSGNKFVKYVSRFYLQNLCNAANERFSKLTLNKLHIEIDDKEEFIVRDFMNEGKTRLLKTLSGGQLFQASLCLALALADSVRGLTEVDRSFFFLDEGFGSLDKESLELVFNTLKALRYENRIVGIISHVEEMQQEIDVNIYITNTEEEGSRIVKLS